MIIKKQLKSNKLMAKAANRIMRRATEFETKLVD
jgi:hypothetical protein